MNQCFPPEVIERILNHYAKPDKWKFKTNMMIDESDRCHIVINMQYIWEKYALTFGRSYSIKYYIGYTKPQKNCQYDISRLLDMNEPIYSNVSLLSVKAQVFEQILNKFKDKRLTDVEDFREQILTYDAKYNIYYMKLKDLKCKPNIMQQEDMDRLIDEIESVVNKIKAIIKVMKDCDEKMKFDKEELAKKIKILEEEKEKLTKNIKL